MTKLLVCVVVGALSGLALSVHAQDGWPAPRSPDGWPAANPPVSQDGWPARTPAPFVGNVASCDYVDGYCRIDIHHPVARRIAASEVQRIGPSSGLVSPQAYANAYAGREVEVVKISFMPMGRRVQAIIEWR